MNKTQHCGSCRNADSDGIPLSKTCQWQCNPTEAGGSLYVSINLPPKVDEATVLRRENRELRVLLAVRVSGKTLYADDGGRRRTQRLQRVAVHRLQARHARAD